MPSAISMFLFWYLFSLLQRKKYNYLFLLSYTISYTHCTFVQPPAREICTFEHAFCIFVQRIASDKAHGYGYKKNAGNRRFYMAVSAVLLLGRTESCCFQYPHFTVGYG